MTIPATYGTHTNYTVVTNNLSDGCSFHIVFTDLNSLYDSSGNKITVVSTSKVVVDYTATLDTDAAFTETNTVYLEYSNNPNNTTTSNTAKDIVTVFTYTLEITKTANYADVSNPLAGAEFTLYKWDADAGEYVLVSTQTGTGTGSNIFTFTGLDDGIYKLVESVTPSGYSTIDDIYFRVDVTHTEDSDGTAKITAYTIAQVNSDGSGLSTAATQTFTTTNFATTGVFSAIVVNHSGSDLPTTGGIGTTIFYIVGGILVLGALIMLVVRRRMSKGQ